MASKDSQTSRAWEADQYPWYADWYGGQTFQGDYWAATYGLPVGVPPLRDNYGRGESLPYYLTARQLKLIRDRSRRMCAENEFAACAIEVRKSFIVGNGFKYRVLGIKDIASDKDVAAAQTVVDTFVRANQLWEIEHETVMRNDRDGETFLRLFPMPNGLLVVRFVEPEHVRTLDGDQEAARSFGIETDPFDIHNVRGYHIVLNPMSASTPVFVKAESIVHFKCNTDSASKRGLPIFYPVESNLRRAEELLAAMSSTEKTRAKIALIRHLEGSSKDAASKLKESLETGTQFDPQTGMVNNVEQMKIGTVLTSSKNISYEFPANSGSESSVSVLQAELRAVAARLVIPEYMLSADASNGTYSSQGLTDSPCTRNFERLQTQYRQWFGESQSPGREGLVWRQLRHAVDSRILPAHILHSVRVLAEPPSIISRNPDQAATANRTYFDMGVKSPQGICSEIGGNYDQVQQERKDAGLPPVNPMAAGMAPGMPAQDPGTQDPNAQQPSDSGDMEFDASMFDDL